MGILLVKDVSSRPIRFEDGFKHNEIKITYLELQIHET